MGSNRGRARYPDSVVQEFIADRTKGMTHVEACAKQGINLKTGTDWWQKHRRSLARVGLGAAAAPKTRGEIRKNHVSRRAYEDFAYFRLVCFGYKTPPWALDAAEKLRASVEQDERKEMLLLNVFPGAGKTSLMQHFVCWLIARNRTIRIVWGSASEKLAEQRVRQIAMHLKRTEPGIDDETDLKKGRAVKPRFCMTDLFGSFVPSAHHGASWTMTSITVSSAGDGINAEGPIPPGPTLVAVGRKTKQLGGRYNFICWDDLWGKDEEENAELGASVRRFYDATVETRLQPGGTLVLVMQRLGPNDLSRYVLNKQMPVWDPATGAEIGYESEYQHIVYPAHHDDLCTGLHPQGMEAWNPADPREGHCLTDPLALPPPDFLRVRGKAVWRVEYQQEDSDPSRSVFSEIWLTGGKDVEGEVFKGCLDHDRAIWELPEGVPPASLASAMAVDVGHERYWGLYAAVSPRDLSQHDEWVLAAEGKIMSAGTDKGLIDYDFTRGCFVGLMEDWWQRSADIGVPFTHVVVEINAAQRHLFKNQNVMNKWQTEHNCRIVSHQTTKNKNDANLGVPGLLQIRYQLGAVRIPWAPGITRGAMAEFYRQLVAYTGKKGEVDDIVMAAWFRTLNRRRFVRPLDVVDPEREARPEQGAKVLDWATKTPRWAQGL